MAKDPAFLFYPGDYLRDTQCLSEKSQVAYDRIMCEHMRNICVTQDQLNFFTKRLSTDEKEEVLRLMKKMPGGYQIEWVAESICKRRLYSDSRRKNKEGKQKNISKSYDSHMEIENENTFSLEGAGNFSFSLQTELPENILVAAEMNQFTHTKKRNTDFVKSQWMVFLKERLSESPQKMKRFKQLNDLTDYFLNWIRSKFPKKERDDETSNAPRLKTLEELNNGN